MSSPEPTDAADLTAVAKGIARGTKASAASGEDGDGEPGGSRMVWIEIPVKTIVRVTLAILVIWLMVQLWNIFLLVFIAFLLAAALAPPAEALQRRGWPAGRAVGTVVLTLLAVLGVGLGFLIPEAIDEGRAIAADLPTYVDQARGALGRYPALEEQVDSLADRGAAGGPGVSASQVVSVGSTIATGVADVLFVLVLAVYLLLDGDRVYGAIARYLSPVQ